MKQKISDLVYLSHKIGGRLDYVQGGGGNISVKISERLMAIKASGYELKNVNEADGFAFVDHSIVNEGIVNLVGNHNGDDEKFSHVVKAAINNVEGYPELRPSMETGFHSLLPFTYVIHSHSIYSNILNCAKQGKNIVDEIYGDALWVDYSNPGWGVTQEIFLSLKNRGESAKVIFLQNHGIIVAGDDVNEVYALHEDITKKIQKFLDIGDLNILECDNVDNEFMNRNVLFPDQIVFGLSEEFAKSDVAKHIFASYACILKTVEKSNLEPIFISQENIDFVANMESEKFRKKVAKK